MRRPKRRLREIHARHDAAPPGNPRGGTPSWAGRSGAAAPRTATPVIAQQSVAMRPAWRANKVSPALKLPGAGNRHQRRARLA